MELIKNILNLGEMYLSYVNVNKSKGGSCLEINEGSSSFAVASHSDQLVGFVANSKSNQN